jgi:hypothetical protein
MTHRKRSRKERRAIHAKRSRDTGPLGNDFGVTEDRRLTSDTAIGTNTTLTHKQKYLLGRKHRVTNTKGDGDSLL